MKNAIVGIVVLAIIGLIIGRLLYINKKTNTQNTSPATFFKEVKKIGKTEVKDDLTIIESNKIYDIGDGKPVITAVINNISPLQEKYPFLKRAYKGDVIITTEDQTVIFDPSTKTIRDISKVSLYEYLSHN